MPPMTKLYGRRFTNLTAITPSGNSKNGHVIWICLCDCGETTEVLATNLLSLNTTSCGCLRKEVTTARSVTHGHTRNRTLSPTYISWAGIITRCTNRKHESYKKYGERGITV